MKKVYLKTKTHEHITRVNISLNNRNGITLIALVISIIVLLILAGITINTLTGENSILIRAGQAKKNTNEEQIRERIKLAYYTTLTDGLGQVDDTRLDNALKKEFGENNYNLDSSHEQYWVVTINQGQSNEVSENIAKPSGIDIGDNGNNNTSTDYSDDVKIKLAVNPNGTTSEEKSPYVIYNNKNYRVLYNNTNGIEIVSANRIETITLGNIDPAELALTPEGQAYVNTNSITLIGTSGDSGTFERAKWSYNNAIATLNYAAEKCRVVGDGIVDSARCVGSIPNNKFSKNTAKFSLTNQWESWFSPRYDDDFEEGEEIHKSETDSFIGTPNYIADKNQMDALGILDTEFDYWLASRYSFEGYSIDYDANNACAFNVRWVHKGGKVDFANGWFCELDYDWRRLRT